MQTPSVKPAFWEIARDIPLVIVALCVCCIAAVESNLLHPPRTSLVALAWPSAFLLLLLPAVRMRRHDAYSPVARWLGLGLFGLVALWLVTLDAWTRVEASLSTLKLGYMVVATIALIVVVLHAYFIEGADFTRRFFTRTLVSVGVVYGMAVLLGYVEATSNESAHIAVTFDLKLATQASFGLIAILYISLWLALETMRALGERIRRPQMVLPVLSALIICTWVVMIEPFASALNLWRWHSALPRSVGDVPLTAWIVAVALMVPLAATFAPSQTKRRPFELPLLVGGSIALFVALSCLHEGGPNGPTFGVLREAAVRHGLLAPDSVWTPGEG